MTDKLDTQELADRIGVSRRTVWRWCKTMNLPHSKHARGHTITFYIRWSGFKVWLRRHHHVITRHANLSDESKRRINELIGWVDTSKVSGRQAGEFIRSLNLEAAS